MKPTKPALKKKATAPAKEKKVAPPDKMILFAREYVIDFNGTRAAQRAGYAGADTVLAVQGARLLRNAKVIDEIESLLSARNRGRELRRARVINELEGIAFDPEAIDVKKDKDGIVYAVSRTDKIKANQLLGQMEGLFTGGGDPEDPESMGGVILLPVKMVGDAWAAQYSGVKK